MCVSVSLFVLSQERNEQHTTSREAIEQKPEVRVVPSIEA